MNTDQPTGGVDMTYGKGDAQNLRFWKPKSSNAPIILFVHGGSWQSGTYMDSIGSAKVAHWTGQGYAFATINYTLIPSVAVEEQVQEVADSLGYLVINATRLDFDPQRIILMGHSSSAHIVTLLELTEDIWRTQESISIPCTLSSLLTAQIKKQ
jgi:acetyl esterase/lipase